MPTSTDVYASHLPVLRAICAELQPQRVLEFGAGFHSTALFLSLNHVEELVSVETDPEWRRRLEEEFDDQRWAAGGAWTLLDGATPNPDGSLAPDPEDFDLVFIDDGKSAPERLRTIRWVLGQEHPPVVIHDAEVPEYAQAMAQLSPTPATAVLCAS